MCVCVSVIVLLAEIKSCTPMAHKRKAGIRSYQLRRSSILERFARFPTHPASACRRIWSKVGNKTDAFRQLHLIFTPAKTRCDNVQTEDLPVGKVLQNLRGKKSTCHTSCYTKKQPPQQKKSQRRCVDFNFPRPRSSSAFPIFSESTTRVKMTSHNNNSQIKLLIGS